MNVKNWVHKLCPKQERPFFQNEPGKRIALKPSRCWDHERAPSYTKSGRSELTKSNPPGTEVDESSKNTKQKGNQLAQTLRKANLK
ncbi:unnamed protein product [Nesidiocoris tenuis]|uniref:Uncharacterized protein n=1 Tax=Nesidiocoris tenuis TaxID=355587 RepID=A0A6H5GLA6_9HEMI|nr:unnamed protein product [Nesidiocoris tenuis]